MKIDSSIKLSPLILLVLSLCFSSCTTTRTMERRVIVHDTLKVNRTDTLRFTALVRDSVYLHDSVYLEGATTVKERIKERWHIRTDTVWRTKTEALHAAHWETAQQKKSPEPSGMPGFWWVLMFLAIAGAVTSRFGKK
jgi:hypothetical protein